MTASQSRALLLRVLLVVVVVAATATTTTTNSNNPSEAAAATEARQQQQQDAAAATGRRPQQESNSNDAVATEPVGAGVAGYLLAAATDHKLNQSDTLDATLASILNRTGPDMRPSRDFRDFDDITLEVSKRAWRLMRHHAQTAAAERVRFVGPIVERALLAANVSAQCSRSARLTAAAAERLDSWAIQLLLSWGSFPPTGLYEGTFGDIGSYHGCVNVPENPVIGHAHYCTISYRPVMPSRKNYELIVRKEPDELLRLFERRHDETKASETVSSSSSSSGQEDAFTEVLRHAQYSHYIYYKLGGCFPIECSPRDVQRLARLLGRRSILMSGPVKCHSKHLDDYEELPSSTSSDHTSPESRSLQISTRDLNDGVYIWKPHINRAQWISLVVVGLVTATIAALTLIDIAVNHLPKLYKNVRASGGDSRRVVRSAPSQSETGNGCAAAKRSPNGAGAASSKERPDQNGGDSAIPMNFYETTGANHQSATTTLMAAHERTSPSSNGANGHTAPLEMNGGGARPSQQPAGDERQKRRRQQEQRSLFMDIVDDYSVITNARQFFRISPNQMKNDILCINGIRCITMSWIIITHTMQYNDWSAFARTREIETHLKSLINQPLFNASYLVDTFFLVSGLLTSFSSFRPTSAPSTAGFRSQLLAKFSSSSYLIGRYLRLTPQILFVSLLFILLPLLSRSGGPHWYTITGEHAENCAQNWWVNMLHIQAFYRSSEMCNFVCWWISVDMFYHLFALALILVILHFGHRPALVACALLVAVPALAQTLHHYQLGLPPNLLATIPQTGAMWSKMTLEFFWSPYAHAFPFFLGFYVGYLMARRKSKLAAWFTFRRTLLGWTLATGLLLAESYSTYFWVIGRWQYTRLVSSLFYLVSPALWAACLTWIILACQYGHGGWINRMLSCKLFIILGKASYIVYLSHFLVLFTFFGSQNLLLEPTQFMMLYVILGNICLSMLLGSLLCIVYEMPWLKTQKRLMRYVP